MPFASFASSSVLQSTLGVPPTKVLIGGTTFVSYVLPPLVCHLVAAVLAVTPRTHTTRVALWPLVALLALRAALSVDVSFGMAGHQFNNTNLVLLMLSITARTLNWTLAKEPLVRHLRPLGSSPSIIMDALDLVSNFRGHGWDWSHSQRYIPRETRPTHRIAFVAYVSLSAIVHALICGVFHRAVVTMTPAGIGPMPGVATIFDENLPFLLRYFRATIISAFTAIELYAVLQLNYDCITLLAVLLLGQDPAQWPPAFDAPWRATSLSDFWGRRWHQFFRHTFLLCGYPLSYVFGRAGLIIGTFFGSVVWHHVAMATLNDRLEVWWMLVGFGMMAPGVLAERAFRRWTGRKVGGVAGWIWTMGWLLLWGNVIVEGDARAGMFASLSALDSRSPLRKPVERLVMGFDAWLHAI